MALHILAEPMIEFQLRKAPLPVDMWSRWPRSQTIRVDNGPEFISKALDRWAYENGVTLDFSRPGKPTDNAFVRVV